MRVCKVSETLQGDGNQSPRKKKTIPPILDDSSTGSGETQNGGVRLMIVESGRDQSTLW